jgi:hypothetical protein
VMGTPDRLVDQRGFLPQLLDLTTMAGDRIDSLYKRGVLDEEAFSLLEYCVLLQVDGVLVVQSYCVKTTVNSVELLLNCCLQHSKPYRC